MARKQAIIDWRGNKKEIGMAGSMPGDLDNDYIEEKFLKARKDDPEFYKDAGNLLSDIYGGDPEQLKLSAYNVHASTSRRDRSNVSIKAPGAESY